jgi:molybdenum cofactor cytidylyltransferase
MNRHQLEAQETDLKQADGVILAAGLSTRSNRYKMALPLGDKSVIERAVEGMLDAVEQIWVVVGWKADRVRQLLAPYPKVEIVPNPAFREGMFSSVKAGIARVRAPHFFLLPGDHPLVGPEVYRRLLAASGEIVIPTFQGRKGHPVRVHSALIPEILGYPADGTLRDYIRSKGFATMEVEEEGILLDVDTPEDYQALRARYEAPPSTDTNLGGTA